MKGEKSGERGTDRVCDQGIMYIFTDITEMHIIRG